MARDYRQRLGQLGEDLACRELRRRGYAIVARRVRQRDGEIDIVARAGDAIVFVEVKARSSLRFGRPIEAVTPRKRRRLRRLAGLYLSRTGTVAASYRFDIVEVILAPSGRPSVRVIEGAFDGSDAW